MSNNKDNSHLVCLYARVSSELQEKERTIESQIAELRSSIAAAGHVLVEEYIDDGYSGELLERPALDRLRGDASKATWSKVYILAPDRLSRKPHIAGIIIEELTGKSIDVIFINRPLGNTIEDQLLFGIQSLFAEYEKEKYKERQRRGKLYKARQGVIVGGKAPYGYRYVREPGTRAGKYVLNDREAAVVRDIYAWYTSGNFYGFRSIIGELHRRGVPTRSGRPVWSQASVSTVLADPTYTGTTYYNRRRRIPAKSKGTQYRRSKNTGRVTRDKSEWIPITVPPIVSHELQARAHAMILRNRKLSPRHVKQQFLLKNLIMCADCGFTYYAVTTGGLKTKRYCYYRCSKSIRIFPSLTDHRPTLPRDLADSAVWARLKAVLTSPEVLAAAVNERLQTATTVQHSAEGDLAAIELKLQRCRAKRGRMLEAYDERVISLEELKAQTVRYDQDLSSLLEQKATLEAQAVPQTEGLTLEAAGAMAKEYRERLEQADFESRRRLVAAIVQKVEAQPTRLVISCALPAIPAASDLHPIASSSSKWSERNSQYRYCFQLAVGIEKIGGKFFIAADRGAPAIPRWQDLVDRA